MNGTGATSADEARRAAVARVGGTGAAVNAMHDQRSFRWVEEPLQDLRYGFRTLRRSPVFAAVVVLSLALGTGANAAIFQLVNAVRLQSLPVERPEELVSIGVDRHGKGRVGRGVRGRSIHTEPLWQALRAEQQAFSSLFAWGSSSWDLSTSGEYRPARGFYVSGNFFDALGVRPHAGRLLSEADDRKGCGSPGAVLSHGFWQSRYGGDRAVVGPSDHARSPRVRDHRRGATGVLRRRSRTHVRRRRPDVRRAAGARRGRRYGRVRDFWWLDIMGRLNPGWTVERAGAHLAAISPGVFNATVSPTYNAEQAGTYKSFTFTAAPAQTGVSNLRTDYATHLWVLLGATGLVLLITCANLANLMLARATAREREIAVRLAIGASRWRIVRQMVTESLLIATLGAIGGGLLARWLSEGLVTFLSTDSNRIFMDLSPDWRVFAFLAAPGRHGLGVVRIESGAESHRHEPGQGDAIRRTLIDRGTPGVRRAPRTGRAPGRVVTGVDRRRGPLWPQPAEPVVGGIWIPLRRHHRHEHRSSPHVGDRGGPPAGVCCRHGAHPRGARRDPRVGNLHCPHEQQRLERTDRGRRRTAGRSDSLQPGRRRVLRHD